MYLQSPRGSVENVSPGVSHGLLQPYQKGIGRGWYKDNQSNACPDELHEYDGTKHLAYLNYDHYGHGGARIENMSDKYWDLVLPHSHLGERLYVEKLLVSDGVCYTRMFQSEISFRH